MWSDMYGVQSPILRQNSAYIFVERCNNLIYDIGDLTLWIVSCHKFDSIMHNLVHTNEVATVVIFEK